MKLVTRGRLAGNRGVTAFVAALFVGTASFAQTVFINEIHYDNTGADTGEQVEIAAPGGTDLSGWSLVLYNGSGGASYATIALSGIVPVQQGGHGTLAFATLGLQNGSPDGLALVDPGSVVVEFLSYEGSFAATNGPANGQLSTDIGVSEPSTSAIGDSLQRVGTGDEGADFNWSGPAPESFGSVNNGQTFSGIATDPLINEFVANHAGSDTAEFVEVLGDPSTDYTAFTVIQLEGDSAGAGVVDSAFVVGTTDGAGFWVSGFLANVLENGTLTLLLVEDFSGSVGLDLDTNNDGVLDALPWARVVDGVSVSDGGVSDRTYAAALAPGFDGDPFTPGGASRIPNGADSDTAADWQRNDFDGEGLPGFSGTPEFGEAFNTPGTTNVAVPAPWILNEINADPSTTLGDANGDGIAHFSDDEFVEIVNSSSGSLDISGWTLADGVAVRHTFPPGTVVPSGCAIVVFGGGSPFGQFGGSFVQTASSGALGLNNGGDTVTLVDGASTIATASYGSEGGNDQSLTLDPDILGTTHVQHLAATGANGRRFSPGTRIDGSLFAGCSLDPVEIFEIQGSFLVSPFAGQSVRTAGDVVTALADNGFFVQTPAASSDGDANTSDAVFVFTGSTPTVAVGDVVDLEGQVTEFFGFTEINASTVTLISSGNPLPSAVVLDAATPSPDPLAPTCPLAGGTVEDNNFECLEGMLVTVPLGTVGGSNQRFGTDPIAEVHITTSGVRAFREPGVQFPGLGGSIPTFDGNPQVFELDADRLGLTNTVIPAGSTFTASGVIGYEFNDYELWPTSLAIDPASLPVAVRAPAADEYAIGSLNVFRLFDDVNDPADPAGRNDTVVSAAEYQRRLTKFALYIVDVMGAPDVLAVQEAEKVEVLEALAAKIVLLDPAVAYSAYLVEGNDIGTIDVGFLVRDTVTVGSVTQLGATETLSVDGSRLHDRPPLLLIAEYTAGGPSRPFGVLALHQRSLGGIEDPVDGPRVRQKRLEQAESVAVMVQAFQDALPLAPLAVVGDFNAYEFTDGFVDVTGHIKGDFDPAESLLSGSDLVDPNLADLILDLDAGDRYSFVFGGSAQVLDHVLANSPLQAFARGAQYARGNADAAVDLINDDATPLRSSDHDGLVLFVENDDDGIPDDQDLCPGTEIPEAVPTVELKPNHWAMVDDDLVFEVAPPNGKGQGNPHGPISLFDTGGCSCDQIIEQLGLGNGQRKFGCPTGVMDQWLAITNP